MEEAGNHTVNTATFDEVYESTVKFVWRCARAMGVPPGQVEDIVQDVFLVVHKRLANFVPGTSQKAWVFAILRRVVSQHRRRLRRKEGRWAVFTEGTQQGVEPSPATRVAEKEAMDKVAAILLAMKPTWREVFVWCELEGMSVRALAKALGAREQTLYSRLSAARKHFEKAVALYQKKELESERLYAVG